MRVCFKYDSPLHVICDVLCVVQYLFKKSKMVASNLELFLLDLYLK